MFSNIHAKIQLMPTFLNLISKINIYLDIEHKWKKTLNNKIHIYTFILEVINESGHSLQFYKTVCY